ncbi:hypothetical protein ECMP0210175_5035 [Escherichia coli MP021017.5]|nr:hypothetical protein ECMP0210179_5036 [Escherichia coli MP021017.9]EMU73060.1 hypothetical protein ECMP0210176_5066 [Escherichia coli MP021017.6]EMU74184.1 hypothetical protein ECMP0210175_5035 [Escherichia coli MP021017.5]EMV01620.1 hypothetical protein ECMP0210173_5137 [Escherichia coli MP021017.3]EMV02101.1 hypothetical protein ECMP0210174_5041 [Escherichia coli MP021017.4]EMV03102.1 hypothetical protein ECMP0210172_5058 [Escherichia coli MP021017.2]EMV03247.1 hypothetical protein ECMP0
MSGDSGGQSKWHPYHPHIALGYRSPREYLRQRASNGLSDNRCLEI